MTTIKNLENGVENTRVKVFLWVFGIAVAAFIILQLTGVIHFKVN